jgi:hypothetical protein
MNKSGTGTQARASGSYGIKGWDEKTWDGVDHKAQSGAKLTHAKVIFAFQGDFQGEGEVQFLMSYRDETYATFVGMMKMSGLLNGRDGSFVVQSIGQFENGAASSKWTIVPGSGTGTLTGISGSGESVATHGDSQPFTLVYSFE